MSEVQDPSTPDAPRHGDTIHTTRIRAGKRTYYFDVKADRKGEHYLTITETRTRLAPDGTPAGLDKQKLFVYAEDMQKFAQALAEATSQMILPDAHCTFDEDTPSPEATPLSNINIGLGDIDF